MKRFHSLILPLQLTSAALYNASLPVLTATGTTCVFVSQDMSSIPIC